MTRKSIVGLSAALAIVFAASANACDKKCSKKGAKTVATAKTASSPCCAKSGKTVATKGAKNAKLAKTPSSPCCAKSGKTASNAKRGCHKGAATLTAGAKGDDSRIAAILASMPSMSYRVGDTDTHCFHAATAKAQETKAAITFVVDGKTYDSRGDANLALATLLTERANEMSDVKMVVGDQTFTCPHAAKGVADKSNSKIRYQLAGFEFDDKDKATELSKKLHETLSTIAVTPKADGKIVPCAKSARASGKTVTFVVGDEETSNETEAKLLLARHLVRTVVETAAGGAF